MPQGSRPSLASSRHVLVRVILNRKRNGNGPGRCPQKVSSLKRFSTSASRRLLRASCFSCWCSYALLLCFHILEVCHWCAQGAPHQYSYSYAYEYLYSLYSYGSICNTSTRTSTRSDCTDVLVHEKVRHSLTVCLEFGFSSFLNREYSTVLILCTYHVKYYYSTRTRTACCTRTVLVRYY